MTTITGGEGLGLFNNSLNQLNGFGGTGKPNVGNGTDNVYVNAATGNLVIQGQDDLVMATGLDVLGLRTYNSRGLLDDENGDNWLLGLNRRLLNVGVTGMTRVNGDGHRSVFTQNGSIWTSTDGAGAHDTLQLVAGQWIYTEGSTRLTETYDTAGKLLSVKDRDGNTLTYGYTGSLLTSVTDASGQVTYIDYSGNNVTQIRVVSQSVTRIRVRYTYDASNRLEQVKVDLANPGDATADASTDTYVTKYAYDGTSRRIANIKQFRANNESATQSQLAIAYVDVGGGDYRVSSLTTTVNATTTRAMTFTYDLVNRRTDVTDALSGVTKFYYDTSNRLTKVTTPAVGGATVSTEYFYDAEGNVSQVKDGAGRSVFHTYSNGNLINSRDDLGNTIARTYNAANQILTETRYVTPDPDGAGAGQPGNPLTTNYVYDGENHLRFAVTAEGRVTEHRYDAVGNRTSTHAYAANTYSSTMTESALAAWVTNTADKSKSELTEYDYDFRGQVEAVTRYRGVDANGVGMASGTYQGQSSLAATTEFIYGISGELLKTVAARGVASSAVDDYVTEYQYDGLMRLTWTKDAGGRVTTTLRDDANNTITLTAAHGLVTTQVFNKAGELLTTTNTGPGSTALGTTTYFYDAAGRQRMVQDPTGGYSHSIYNERGWLVGAVSSGGVLTEFEHNGAGQVVKTIGYANTVSSSLLVSGGQPLAVTIATLRNAANAGPNPTSQNRATYAIYDAAGRLAYEVDGESYAVKHSYDGAGRLIESLRYDSALTSALPANPTVADVAARISPSASNDRKTRFFYDNDGNLRGTLDAEGYLVEQQYDAAGRLTATIRYATKTNSAYWASGTLAQLIPAADATNDQRSYNLYNAHGHKVGHVDAQGYLTEYVYDRNGNKQTEMRFATAVSYSGQTLDGVEALAGTWKTTHWEFDTLDRAYQEENIEGTITTYTYDANSGFLTSTTKALSTEPRTTNYTHDALGRVKTETVDPGALGLVTQHAYDLAGRKVHTIDADGKKTLYYYDRDSRLRYTVNHAGEVTELRYTTFGEVKETVQYAQRISTASLVGGLADLDANLTSRIAAIAADANNRTTTTTYTNRGLADVTINALGATAADFTYNAFKEAISNAFNVGTVGSPITRTDQYTYDKRGLRTKTVEDFGGIARTTQILKSDGTTSGYDAFGRVVSAKDANGIYRTTTYDRLGRVVTSTDPAGNVTTTYDAHSRVLTQVDRLGKTTSYAYNDTNRTVTVTTPEGIVTQRTHNRHGQDISVTLTNNGVAQTTSFEYDNAGRLTKTTDANGSFETKTYESGKARLWRTTDKNGVITEYAYDTANRVFTRKGDAVSGGLQLTTTYEYSAFGETIKVTDAEGVVTETVYDKNSRAVAVVVDTAGLKIATTYTLNGLGNQLTLKEGIQATGSSGNWNVSGPATRTTNYVYDNLGRRTSETVAPGVLNLTTAYAYDGNGNMVRKTDANGNVWRYLHDANNRLVYTVDCLNHVTKATYDAEWRVIETRRYYNPNAATLTDSSTATSYTAPATNAADRVTRTAYDDDGRRR